MKRLLIIAFIALPLAAQSAGITNGIYEIRYRFSDAADAQEVTITNCWSPSPSIMYFDVLIEKNGGLKTRDQDKQSVRGIVHIDTFTFIIPFVSGSTIQAMVFTGSNHEIEGSINGKGYYTYPGIDDPDNKFHFWIKKKET